MYSFLTEFYNNLSELSDGLQSNAVKFKQTDL